MAIARQLESAGKGKDKGKQQTNPNTQTVADMKAGRKPFKFKGSRGQRKHLHIQEDLET